MERRASGRSDAEAAGGGGGGVRVDKWKLLQANWAYQGRQFFETSTLHGVRYIAEKGRPPHERLLWFVSTTAGLMAALVIVGSLWDKFQTSPTITGLDTEYHEWDVPFPAVSLCPQDPGNDTLIDAYIQERWPNADEEKQAYYRKYLNAVTNVSYANLPDLMPFLDDEDLPRTDLRQLSNSLFYRCHMFTQCAYKRSLAEETRDCCELLFPVFTEHGLCFAFNLNHSLPDWPGGSMRPKVFKQSFIEETDSRWSFSFDTDDAANNSVAVYISSSNDLPGMDQNPQHIWNKRVSKLMFVPKMTYTVAGARQLSVRQRGCVFPDEVKLRVSHVYSYTACQRQCRMDRIVRLCGCLPAFYTLLRGQRYCHLRELKCVVDNLEKLSPTTLRCDCPLGCEHTVYDMEKPHEAGGDEGSEELPGVEVGFLSWPLTRFKRDVLFGQVDLLVAIGTIGGLFLGLSLLSGVEIVYLFTLRAWCMLHTDRAHLEELAEEYARKEKQPVDLSLRPAFLKAQEAGGVVAVTPAGQRGPPVWKRDPVLARISKKMKGRGGDVYPYLH